MKLTQSLLRPIHDTGKSHARRMARNKRNAISQQATKEANDVFPGVKKGHKKYPAKMGFKENRIVHYLEPRQKEIAKARKALDTHLAQAAANGRAV